MANKKASPYAWLLPWMTLGLGIGIVLGKNAESWLFAAAALVMSATAACLVKGTRRVLALTLAAVSLGAVAVFGANHPVLPPEGNYIISGVVVDEIVTEEGRFTTVLADVTLNDEPISGEAYWSAYFDEEKELLPDWFTPGARVTFSGKVYHPSGEDNPGGYDFREKLLQEGILIGLYGMDDLRTTPGAFSLTGTLAAFRHRLTIGLMDVIGEESGALAAAMVLGARHYIPAEDDAAFKALGIVHILSISGYHVGVLAMLLGWLLRPMKISKGTSMALRTAVILLYVLLTGANPPVVRAAILVLLRDAGRMSNRRNLPLHLICLAAAVQLLMRPMLLFGASFQLTYAAMLGILLVYPWLKRQVHFRRRSAQWLWEGFAVSLAAQLGILPAQLYWFCGFPVVSVFINGIVIALTSGVMLLYWGMLPVLAVPVLRDVLGALAGGLTSLLLSGVRALAGLVGGSLWTPRGNLLTLAGWILVMLALSILLTRRQRMLRRWLLAAGSLLLVISLIPLPNAGTYWIQFSEGEADAALLHDRNTVTVVDTGSDGYGLAKYLQHRRLSVDTLVITHLHADHAGGIEALLACGIPVKHCLLPEDAYKASDIDPIVPILLEELAATGTTIEYVARGDEISTPNAVFTVLWPQSGMVRSGHEANDSSLVLRAEILGSTMLLTADLSGRYEMYCAVPADILKAAHHGSAGSTSPEFLAAVEPQVILLSCGEAKREASLATRTDDIPVYSTHSRGAVTIRFLEDGFRVKTYLPAGK